VMRWGGVGAVLEPYKLVCVAEPEELTCGRFDVDERRRGAVSPASVHT
jgi:hypothetical protein